MSEEDATEGHDPEDAPDEAATAPEEGWESVPDESADGETADDERSVERLLDEVAEHDESLATALRRVVEPHDAAGDQEDRIAELEADLADREDRIEALETALADREERVDELEDRLRRTQADFQNYKKRAQKKRERVEERATEDLIERLLDVRDNLRRALEEEEDADAESLRDGVEMTLREFDRVLEEENVSEIAPEPGAAIDPTRHEVMLRTDSEQPPDTVADLYAPGYEMAGEVVRPARVTVSTGPAEDAEEDDPETEEPDATN